MYNAKYKNCAICVMLIHVEMSLSMLLGCSCMNLLYCIVSLFCDNSFVESMQRLTSELYYKVHIDVDYLVGSRFFTR